MSDDLQYCVKILDEAIKFEEEGMAFFLQREKSAPSKMERSIFSSLAADEAGHRTYLVKMREELLATNDISAIQIEDVDDTQSAQKIFSEAMEHASSCDVYKLDELEVLRGALEVERSGYKMYSDAANGVNSAEAKKTFEHLAAQEQEHFRLLSNTLSYLSDPAGFHSFDESPMLDGG